MNAGFLRPNFKCPEFCEKVMTIWGCFSCIGIWLAALWLKKSTSAIPILISFAFVQLGTDRNATMPGSFWGSPECARMDGVLQGQLSRQAPADSPLRFTTIPTSIGFDYVEMYDSVNRSTGIVCIK